MQGFSLVELLAVLILLGLVITPALGSLQGALQSEQVNRAALVDDYRLVDITEQVLAEPFGRLVAAAEGPVTPSRYSDAAGTAARRLVFISRFDADNADLDDDELTGADDGILKIRVQIEASAAQLSVLRHNG